jgi:RNA polymerase sigma factor (sigma-70 family)
MNVRAVRKPRETTVTGLNGSFECFYREHRQMLFTYALVITRCAARAEDAVQEAFCRLHRLAPAPGELKAYAFRTVRNAALDIARRPWPAAALDESILDPTPGPQEDAVEHELAQRAAAALKNLGDEEREAIVLRIYGDMTFREIAELCNTPLGTVTARYQRGLEKLRTLMEADNG